MHYTRAAWAALLMVELVSADNDISYNPTLGTGQLQVRDIHYVRYKYRTTWEFCQLLDQKCIASKKGFDQWLAYAESNKWVK